MKKYHYAKYEKVLQKEELKKDSKKHKQRITKSKVFGPNKQLTMIEVFEGKHRMMYDRNSEKPVRDYI